MRILNKHRGLLGVRAKIKSGKTFFGKKFGEFLKMDIL